MVGLTTTSSIVCNQVKNIYNINHLIDVYIIANELCNERSQNCENLSSKSLVA